MPLVLLTALLCWLVPPLLFRQPWSDWTYSALVLLVIACPCALVISTPVSIVAAVANAARRGVLIKGGRFVELPAHLTAIAFDKTGTLTHGQLTVTGVHPKTADGAGELMEQAVQLEHGQNHPIARAILHHGRHLGIQDLPSGAAPRLDGRTLPGRGTIARRGDREHWIGSPREARQRVGADPWLESQLAAIDADGCTAVVVGQADQVMGVISLSDTLRADAPAVLHELHSLGVRELWMLTGDQASAANSIARPLPLDRVSAELMPIDKVHAVEQLCGQHAIVAMVGDGVNDAPALTAATIGIAMGAIGSDLALETADIALMTDDLSRLPWLVRHARRTLRIIRQNVFFSLAVKLLFIGLTLAGHASLWLAILADTGAALLVTANALRLLRSPAGRQRSDKPADRSVDPG
jgi:Cd2+/Zn2+-exporting ATPase